MSGDCSLSYRFNVDVLSVGREGDRVTIDVKDWRPIAFTAPRSAYADAVMALAGDGVPVAKLDALAQASGEGDDKAAAAVRYYLERFARGRLLAWRVADDGGELLRADALASRYLPRLDAPPAGDLELSRFAFLRLTAQGTVLESGAVRVRSVLTARGLTAVAERLGSPLTAADGLSEALWRLGYLDIADPEESGPRRCWEFHDLLMHESSRGNRDAVAVGGTYRFEGKFPSLPARKPAMEGERIALPAVDTGQVRQASRSLDAVQAARLSVRHYSEEPISLAKLGEFLWRVCRTTEHIGDKRQDLISRPYPAGGSINELEFYVSVRRCAGLEPAIYHYDSHDHALVRLVGTDKTAEKIVDRSGMAMGLEADRQRPDLTIVITSRLSRLAWKYEGMAYRASLMNAGVVFELMYLVATDMGLAPCANGTGDSRLLEEAAGLDPFEETPIAEFVLAMPAA
jgi:SagB-type dehydrogenase family enzyme